MKTTAWLAALAITFTLGLNLRPAPTVIIETVTTAEHVETIRHPLTDAIVDILARDVHAPETDEHRLYACFLQLIGDDDWHATIAYIERKWAGDACQALDHLLLHGWF